MTSLARINRALKQPIFLLSADYNDCDDWKFCVKGFSGNFYNIVINPNEINCSCPDYTQRHNICKHIFFIIGRVAQDQNCLLKINKYVNPFDIKPDLTKILKKRLSGRLNIEKIENIEKYGDCCICFEELTSQTNNFKCNQCNNYIHRLCMNIWTNTNNNCPLCRNIYISVTDEETNDLAYFENFIVNSE